MGLEAAVFVLFGAQIGLFDLAFEGTVGLAKIIGAVQVQYLRFDLLLFLVCGCFAAYEHLREVLIHEWFEVILAEDRHDEGGVDLGGVVASDGLHHVVAHGAVSLRGYLFMEESR
jgi:hypothetical protein